ncbi:MAG: hypothetical protein KDK00_09555 [Rhodobacteraceae bacterium]|nr:hypothetical protein [Paracoccaceae bacterium]
MKRLIVALTLLSFLSACGAVRDSRLNPFNWFGRDREERVQAVEIQGPVETRPLVAQVISLKVDRMPGGAIIYAVGLPATQGHWDAELVSLNGEVPEKGTLTYEFRLAPPPGPTRQSTPQSREVVVGLFVSDQALLGVRNIAVIAQQNRRSVRR